MIECITIMQAFFSKDTNNIEVPGKKTEILNYGSRLVCYAAYETGTNFIYKQKLSG